MLSLNSELFLYCDWKNLKRKYVLISLEYSTPLLCKRLIFKTEQQNINNEIEIA